MKEKKQAGETVKPMKKPPKIPGAFRKPIKKKIFEKNYVKHVEHAADRKFFAGSFELKDDAYFLREGLSADDVKKLKMLLGVIKKNRKGAVKLIPLVFAAVVVAAIVVFFAVFANPLLGRAMEKGLEAAFEARSDVRGFRLSLFRFSIGIREITVANRDSPMKNLFQMGKTEIRLKPAAVLRGKIYIEEVRADSIRFGTDRTVSGALPDRPPKVKVKKEKPKSDAPPLVDLKNFDAMALLNREYEKLNTPKLYDQAISAYNETLSKWQGQVELVKTRSEELKAQSQPVLNINVNNIRDIQTVTKTVQDITTLVNTIQATADDATNMVNGIEADIKMAQNLEQNARNAITGDINHLKSYINLGSGEAFAALEPSIREVLSGTAEQYLDYGIRALEVLEKLKIQAAAKPKTEKPEKKPKAAAFKGRDVIFPTQAYPQFYLGTLASDFTLESWNWAFALNDISSEPDLTGKPVTLTLGLTESGGNLERQVAVEGSADFRTNPVERFSANISAEGFPFALGDDLSAAGINGFDGIAAFAFNLNGRTDGGVSGGGDVRITRARIIDPAGTIAEAVDTAVKQAGQINMGIQYAHWTDRDDELKITTNIAELANNALRAVASAYTQRALDEVEKALREKITQYIDGKFVSKAELDMLFNAARGDKAAVDQLKNALDNKKAEFEQRAKAAAEQAVQQVTDDMKQQGQQAIQDIMQGKQPTLEVPALPSIPGLKLPGR